MTTRQYAQKSIFERSRKNDSELERLLSEMTFRNTARAKTLKNQIEHTLTELSGRSVTSMSGSSLSTRHGSAVPMLSSQIVPSDAPDLPLT